MAAKGCVNYLDSTEGTEKLTLPCTGIWLWERTESLVESDEMETIGGGGRGEGRLRISDVRDTGTTCLGVQCILASLLTG